MNTDSIQARGGCWYRWLLYLLVAFVGTGKVALAGTCDAKPAAHSYRVIQLATAPRGKAIINARGQVAFNVEIHGRSRARFFDGRRIRDFGTLGGANASVAALNDRGQIAFNVERKGNPRAVFYDGRRLHDIGTLGGPGASAVALNDRGQVAGTSSIAPEGSIIHPYRWSQSEGMVDLGRAGLFRAVVIDINNRGQVVGQATFGGPDVSEPHGFFWSPRTGVIDIGVRGEVSYPTAVNDAGTVVGYGGTGPYDVRAFRWSRATGASDMGTLPNEFTWATHINQAGQVVGATPFVPAGEPHAFLWSPGQGLQDLGTGSGQRAAGTKVNEHGTVIGYVITLGTLWHGFIWTRETGFLELGAGAPEIHTSANDVNNRGQVVGSFGSRAFIWTRSQGIIDLNTLATAGPHNLVLTSAEAISETGSILAAANTGLYLLMPLEGRHHRHCP